MHSLGRALVCVAALVGSPPFGAPQAAAAMLPVDVELSLLVDTSGSIDAAKFVLQRTGYVDAFRSAAIQDAITSTADGRLGRIAVNMIYWSGAAQQSEVVPWTLIDGSASANAFADAIGGTSQLFFGTTAPGSAIDYAVPRFAANAFEGAARVIDVSGDGAENDGVPTAGARAAALVAGVDRINGLPILGGDAGLFEFYQANVQGGAGSFTLAAAGFGDFGQAVAQKLAFEITGTNPIPLPPAGLALVGALIGLAAVGRRRRPA
jgi:hypothetical protein